VPEASRPTSGPHRSHWARPRERGDAGIPFTGVNWSKLAETQEESPRRAHSWAASAMGICPTTREGEGGGTRSLGVPRLNGSGASGCLLAGRGDVGWHLLEALAVVGGMTGWVGSVSHPSLTLPPPPSAELPPTKRSVQLGVGGTWAGWYERGSPVGARARRLAGGTPKPPSLSTHRLLAGGRRTLPPGPRVQAQPRCRRSDVGRARGPILPWLQGQRL